MATGNIKNLIPNSQRTPEELREMTRKAGIKSGEIRKKQKTMCELIKLIQKGKVSEEITNKIIEIYPHLEKEDVNRKVLPLIKQQEKAEKGDLQALMFLRDTAGEKPTEKIENTTEMTIKGKDVAEFTKELRDSLRKE